MAKEREQEGAETKDERPSGVPLAERIAVLRQKGIEVFESTSVDTEDREFRMTFRAPNQSHLARYMRNSQASNAVRAGMQFCQDVVLDPPKEELVDALEARPGLVLSCVNEILESVGGGQVFSRRRI